MGKSLGTVLNVVGFAVTGNPWFLVAEAASQYGQYEQRKARSRALAAQREAYNAGLSDRTVSIVSADNPWQILYGEPTVGPAYTAILTSGDKDQFKHLVAVWAAHECDAITKVMLAGEDIGTLDSDGWVTSGRWFEGRTETHSQTVTLNGTTPVALAHEATSLVTVHRNGTAPEDPAYQPPTGLVVVDGATVKLSSSDAAWNTATVVLTYEYATGTSRLRVRHHLGTDSQTADAALLADVPDEWSSTDRGRGLTYSVFTFDLNEPEFQGGPPQPTARIRGKKVYDPRKDSTQPGGSGSHRADTPSTWQFSKNNVLCTTDYIRGEYGKGARTNQIRWDTVMAGANGCDQTLTVDGDTVKRYEVCAAVRTSEDPDTVLDLLCQSMAGFATFDGAWRLQAGVYSAPVMALTDADNMGSVEVQPSAPFSELMNGVRGRFFDPERFDQLTDYPPYQNGALVTEDGGAEYWDDLDLPYTGEAWRAHNLARIFVERSRGRQLVYPAKLKALRLRVGQRITLTSAKLNLSAAIFRVVRRSFEPGGPVMLTLMQDDPTYWDEADAPATVLPPTMTNPNPFLVAAPTGLAASSGPSATLRDDDGTVISRARVDWDAAADVNVQRYGAMQLETRLDSETTWRRHPDAPGDSEGVPLYGLQDSQTYVVRARWRNGIGRFSDWRSVPLVTQGPSAITLPAVYWVRSSAAAIVKGLSGLFTPATVTFNAYSATGSGAPSPYAGRFIISTSTDGSTFTTAYTSSANESSASLTVPAGTAAVRVRLYVAGGTTTLLDEETVPVVADGGQGITHVLSNAAHALPSAADGTVGSYARSGTTIKLFEGATALTFHTTLAPGRFTIGTPVVAPSGAITVGARSGSGTTTCTVADHSAASGSVDVITITYPVTVRLSGGTDVSFDLQQTLTKARAGADGANGMLVDNGGFEAGSSVGWVAVDATGAAIEEDSATANTGSWRLRIGVSDGTSRTAYRNKDFPVVPGERYTLSARVRSATGTTGQAYARIAWRDSAGTPSYSTLTWTPAQTLGAYLGKQASMLAPAGVVQAEVQLGQTSQTGGNWYFDDVVCQPVGADGEAFWLSRSAAALSKDPRTGAYTPPAITFKAYSVQGGAAPAPYAGRFVIGTSTDGTTFTTTYTSSADETSKAYTVPAGVVAVRVQLFQAGGTTLALDEEIVPVVTDGTHALTPVLSNAAHVLPATSDGTVTSYAGSGTNIKVFEGSDALTFHTTLAPGRFTVGTPVVSPAGAITVGARSGSGTSTCTVGVHSAADAGEDVITITYPVTARRADGTDVAFNVAQTVSKAKAGAVGAAGTAYWLSRSAASVAYDAQAGTYTPAIVTFSAYASTGGGTPALYPGRFVIATSPDGSTYTTAYSSADNEPSKAFTVPAGTASLRVRLYLAGGTSTLLDEEIVPVVNTGRHGLTQVVGNAAHVLPASAAGVVSGYTGSGTTLQVYEGSAALTFHTTLAAGRFTVGTPTVSPAGAITVGARGGSGTTTCTVADHSGASSGVDVITITYPVTARRADGTDVSLSLVQTVTKARAGADGASGQLVDNGGFEDGESGWTALSITGHVIEEDAATANTGSWRLRIAVTDGVNRQGYRNKIFPVVPGQRFVLGASVRSAAGTTGTSRVRIRFMDAAGDFVAATQISFTAAETLGVYVPKVITATVPAGAATAYVDAGEVGQTAGTWYIDDIFCQPGAQDGAAATAYWLGRSAASVVRDAASGAYTPASVTFRAYAATGTGSPVAYPGRFIIATSPDGSTYTTVYTSAVDEDDKAFTVPAGVATIRVRLYLAGGTSVLLDEEIVPVVTDGSNALTPVVGNSAHALPATNSGSVTSYAGSGTTIKVFEGSTALNFHTSLAAGRFVIGTPVVSPAGAITVGSRSGSGTSTCTVGVHSAADAGEDVITITYPVTARRADGTDVAFNLVQTLTKSKSGATGAAGTAYWMARSAGSVALNPQTGVYTPGSITFSAYSATGSGGPAPYAGRFVIATTTDGSSYSTQYTSASNQSSTTFAVPDGVLAIRARLYLEDGTTVKLDEETVPVVVSGDSGLTPVVSNSAHALPANSSGSVTTYSGSGTTIKVFEGSTALVFSTALSPGRFTVGTPTVSPTGDIVVGARSGSGSTTCTVANHSAADAATNVITITYPITAQRANGDTVAFNVVQTLTKAKAGTPAIVDGWQDYVAGPLEFGTSGRPVTGKVTTRTFTPGADGKVTVMCQCNAESSGIIFGANALYAYIEVAGDITLSARTGMRNGDRYGYTAQGIFDVVAGVQVKVGLYASASLTSECTIYDAAVVTTYSA